MVGGWGGGPRGRNRRLALCSANSDSAARRAAISSMDPLPFLQILPRHGLPSNDGGAIRTAPLTPASVAPGGIDLIECDDDFERYQHHDNQFEAQRSAGHHGVHKRIVRSRAPCGPPL